MSQIKNMPGPVTMLTYDAVVVTVGGAFTNNTATYCHHDGPLWDKVYGFNNWKLVCHFRIAVPTARTMSVGIAAAGGAYATYGRYDYANSSGATQNVVMTSVVTAATLRAGLASSVTSPGAMAAMAGIDAGANVNGYGHSIFVCPLDHPWTEGHDVTA